jgi:hypothetical protein
VPVHVAMTLSAEAGVQSAHADVAAGSMIAASAKARATRGTRRDRIVHCRTVHTFQMLTDAPCLKAEVISNPVVQVTALEPCRG